ncbi:hypothetical protein, partial [Campylobacter sp.]|uniref:hypothetical protein n=1 Tax=Campylobacter sp. TaxID=205 RepID=UPI003607B556
MANKKRIEIIEKHIIEAKSYLNKEPKEIYVFFNYLNATYKNIEEIYIPVRPAAISLYYDTPID